MRRDEAMAILSAHRDRWRRFGVRSLSLFGSVASDEAGPESDLDILVEFDGPATFDNYMDLKFLLEDLLGVQVDLVTRKALKPRLRIRIERQAVLVP